MKRLIILITFLLSSFCGYSQSKYFFGVNAGISFIKDNALSSSVVGAEFDNKPKLIFPALVGVYISDKSRVRLDLGGFKIESKLNYNYNPPQTNDPSLPNQSEVFIKTQTVNLNYDYRVVGREKFDIYASAGLRSLFSTNKKEVTTYSDGHEEDTAILIYDYNRNIFGLGAGVVAKYNHTDKSAYTFTPDYAYYFGDFNKGNNNNLKRLSLAIGVEFRL